MSYNYNQSFKNADIVPFYKIITSLKDSNVTMVVVLELYAQDSNFPLVEQKYRHWYNGSKKPVNTIVLNETHCILCMEIE